MSELVEKILAALKGLTLTNVLVIIVLGLFIGPAYLAWRVLNDPVLLSIVFSNYTELPIATDECNVVAASYRGQDDAFFVRDMFRQRGQETWYIGVRLRKEPSEEQAQAYCSALTGIVDFARDPINTKRPTFPGSDVVILGGAPL